MPLNTLKYFLLVLFLGICLSFDLPEHPVIKHSSTFFTSDNIGNIYLVNHDELLKYTPDGKLFRRYSNLKLGDISFVDATNVLKPLLFYKDYQQIVFLDNQLTENSSPISLEKLGYEQTELACSSANNSFWIYSKQNNELIRFDEASRKTVNTGNLKQLLKEDIEPNFMIEHNGHLFLNSPQHGIFEFDMFGAYIRTIAIKHLKQFQVDESVIYYLHQNRFCSYHYGLFEEKCSNSIPSNCTSVRYATKNYFMQFPDSIVYGKTLLLKKE